MTAPPSRAPHENPRGQVTQGIFFYPTTSENLVHICPIFVPCHIAPLFAAAAVDDASDFRRFSDGAERFPLS